MRVVQFGKAKEMGCSTCGALILWTALAGALPEASAQIPVDPAVPESLGVNIHFTDARPGEMEMLAGAGLRWIRTDLIWAHTERQPGEYDFAAYDRLVASLEKNGVRALLILNGRNRLYDRGQFPFTDEGRAACARWAAAAVRHFRGKGILWEMWNEPNVKERDSPTAEVYAKLALAVGEAIQKAAPKESYVGPATSLIDMPFLEACFKAGLLRYWSGVTVHPYRFQDPETVIPDYAELRALVARYAPRGRTIPILQGEWGWASSGYNQSILWFQEEMDSEIQGKLLARQWLTNLACSIPLSIWYDWHDDGSNPRNPEHNCGMVLNAYHPGQNPVYTPKPAYLAAQALTGVLRGYRFEKHVPAGQPGDYVLAFRRGRLVRFAAWTVSSTPHTVRIPANQGPCRIIGHKGEDRGTTPVAQGAVSLSLSNAPQYLLCGDARTPSFSQALIWSHPETEATASPDLRRDRRDR